MEKFESGFKCKVISYLNLGTEQIEVYMCHCDESRDKVQKVHKQVMFVDTVSVNITHPEYTREYFHLSLGIVYLCTSANL